MKPYRPRRLMFTETPAGDPATDPAGNGGSTDPEPSADPSPAPEAEWQTKYEAQRQVNRDLERKLKASLSKDDAEALRAELAKLQGKEAEYAEAAKAREVEAAALGKANERILKAEIRAAAAGRLADPSDALHYLDLGTFQVGDDGDVDAAAVTEAIEALVKSKPYLAAQGGNSVVIASPTASREGATDKAQWTKDDLKGKTPDQINAARAEGRLNDLLGIKN